MKNSQNLKPFTKGTSGNPSGRRKGSKNVSTLLTELLEKSAPEAVAEAKIVKEFIHKRGKITNADALAATLLYQAIVKANPKAIAEINKMTGNYSPTRLAHEDQDGGPMKVIVEYANDPADPS